MQTVRARQPRGVIALDLSHIFVSRFRRLITLLLASRNIYQCHINIFNKSTKQ